MGKDIHMHIVKDGVELAHDIYDGRCSEWFDNLTGHLYTEPAYQEFPSVYYWENCGCPQELYDRYTGRFDYFDHEAIQVCDFKRWYQKYQPYLKAGYVTKYDAWLYEKKNITPNVDNLEHYLWNSDSEDNHIVDKVWIEFVDKYEQSICIMDYLEENNIPNDAWIIYCFSW